jgi:hypothetical protein
MTTEVWKLCLVGGFNPSENMKVSWDYYSQLNGKNKSHVPKHQPVMVYI